MSFPKLIEGGVYLNGYNAASSYGANSYFIRNPEGNWLIDSPRFHPVLVKQFEELGEVRYIFLTHRDDVADADRYAQAFGAQRIIHQADHSAQPDAEIVLDTAEDVVMGQAQIIHTPGHTRGHCVLLWQEKYLFTGDHLAWSQEENALRAFREYCWYSWKEQIRSVEKLGRYSDVEWILPGHGERKRITQHGFPRLIHETVKWMKA